MRRAREEHKCGGGALDRRADDAAALAHRDPEGARQTRHGAPRRPLVQLGIDPATVAMLRIADEAAQELAVTADGGGARRECTAACG